VTRSTTPGIATDPTTPAPAPAHTLRFFDGAGALFVGPLPAPVPHRHHALQGFVGLEGDVRVEVAGATLEPMAGGLIAPDTEHALEAEGPVAHFYTLPESRRGARIRARLGRHAWLPLDPDAVARLRAALRPLPSDPTEVQGCLDLGLRLAIGAAADAHESAIASAAPGLDPRVEAALEHLRSTGPEATLGEVAEQVALGPDRLRHLLRAELGLTFRELRRWLRLLRALEALRAGASITQAASVSGFADTAHLTRTFRQAFTFPPSAFVAESRFVQAQAGPAA